MPLYSTDDKSYFGNDLVSSGHKSFPEQMLIEIYAVIWRYSATAG